jgi:hypothetical protein
MPRQVLTANTVAKEREATLKITLPPQCRQSIPHCNRNERFLAQPRDPDRCNYPLESDLELMPATAVEKIRMLKIVRAM